MGDFIGTTISGMTGRGSIRHNNRSFTAANVDRSRTGQNVTFCNEDLKQVYHEVFDEALAAYNAKKKKTRDKIPDYYEHIRQSKQEKLFHEAIFQIGNLNDCGCGSPGGERAAAALKEFAESFQERNPHLRVFNMVLHMDEATPHLHVDFVPVATEQTRGLSTRVSMKQAFSENAPSTTDNRLTGAVDGLVDAPSTKNDEKTVAVDGEISVLQATIDTLQGQLEMKDRQIEQQAQTITRLTDALAAAQQTAAAAQALHAGTIQQQLLTGETGAEQQGREPEQKRSWFSRLFRG